MSETADRHSQLNENTCTACGSQIDPSEWHPVSIDRPEEAIDSVHHFCDDACHDRWKAEME